jgi:hypothetical protein
LFNLKQAMLKTLPRISLICADSFSNSRQKEVF